MATERKIRIPITLKKLEHTKDHLAKLPANFLIAVIFHNDGGQACLPDVRHFPKTEIDKAIEFAKEQDDQPGHYCKDSVFIFLTNSLLGWKDIQPL